MWFQTVHAETAPRVLRDTPFRVKARRLWATTKEVFSRGSTAFGATLIALMLVMAIFAPLIVDQNPRGAYQMPRDLTAVAVPPGTEGHPPRGVPCSSPARADSARSTTRRPRRSTTRIRAAR